MQKSVGSMLVAVSATLSGCAGHVGYLPPSNNPAMADNVRFVDKPRDAVWASAVPELSKRFFTINNLDKASGLINMSYSGDPEQFIDCGQITSFVKNARGERTYEFPASRAQQSYETLEPGGLFFLDRRMALEGRINLVFEDAGPARTKVTANTRYVLTRTVSVARADGRPGGTFNDTTSFNSNAGGTMGSGPTALTCNATGGLERQVLEILQ